MLKFAITGLLAASLGFGGGYGTHLYRSTKPFVPQTLVAEAPPDSNGATIELYQDKHYCKGEAQFVLLKQPGEETWEGCWTVIFEGAGIQMTFTNGQAVRLPAQIFNPRKNPNNT